MKRLLQIAHGIDWLNDHIANAAKWAILLSCLISAANAGLRYAFDISSNARLEIQWYLFAGCVMLGAAQVLRLNEHVRVDVLYGRLSSRARVWVDLFGLCAFLLPVLAVLLWFTWPHFFRTFHSQEVSSNAGGLIRWPVVLTIPLGFSLLALQGCSEIIKRTACLLGLYDMHWQYERPLQ
jgi:TRAP-type mannitol/chloroaromatic compound transport system permease small subunit